jgi:hypothetical protein
VLKRDWKTKRYQREGEEREILRLDDKTHQTPPSFKLTLLYLRVDKG